PVTPPLGPRLGSGARAEAFASGENALKLYPAGEPAATALAHAAHQAIAQSRGAPAPQVLSVTQYGYRCGILMARCPCLSLFDHIQAGADPAESLATMAALQSRLHALDGTGLPGQRARLARQIAAAPLAPATRQAALDRLTRLSTGAQRLCHGDFHPANILGPPEAPQVIDWVDATSGEPLADLCRSHLLLSLHAPAL